LCNGPNCLLCRIGRRAESRDLWPVYDVVTQVVGVLPISANLRPHALKPQLMPVLRHLQANKRVLLGICKPDRMRFSVDHLELPEDADDGADEIARFQAQLEDGVIDLAAVYPQMTNEELAAIPEVATVATLRGIVP